MLGISAAVVSGIVRGEESPSPGTGLPREIDPNVVTPGLVGLFFFVALFVAGYFLMRSFVRQLRKIDIPGEDSPAVDHTVDAGDS